MKHFEGEESKKNLLTQPEGFRYVVKFDCHIHLDFTRDTWTRDIELWCCFKKGADVQAFHPRRWKIFFYGVSPVTSLPPQNLTLSIYSIKDRQWEDLAYEVRDFEEGHLFYCKHFEARLEDVHLEID